MLLQYRSHKSPYVLARVSLAVAVAALCLALSFTPVGASLPNQKPAFTGGSISHSVAENTPVGSYVGLTVAAQDPDGDALTYALEGSMAFAVHSGSGQVITLESLDYEAQSSYRLTVTVSDGKNASGEADAAADDSIAVTISVTDVNEAPVAADDSASTALDTPVDISVLDNDTDPDAGATLTVRSVGFPNHGAAAVNPGSGGITYLPGPGFRGHDSFSYTIDDGALTAQATVTVAVAPVSAAPPQSQPAMGPIPGSPTSPEHPTRPGDQGTPITGHQRNDPPTVSGPAKLKYAENGTGTVATYTANDPDGDTVVWSLWGPDGLSFGISNGVLTFKSPPNYEKPADSDKNNVYSVRVSVSDSKDDRGAPDSRVDNAIAVTVTVTDDETDTANFHVRYAENGKRSVTAISKVDMGLPSRILVPIQGEDNGRPVHGFNPEPPNLSNSRFTSDYPVTWSVSGIDGILFNISSDGVLTFKSSPDYENPKDRINGDNVYSVTVNAVVRTQSLQTFKFISGAVTVTDVNEAPTVTGDAAVDYAENGAGNVATYSVSDPDAGATHTWTLEGSDAGSFDISSDGALTFKTPPDYEAKSSYSVTVKATDNGSPALSGTLAVTVTVTDVNEAPAVSGEAAVNYAENGSGTVAIYRAQAPDPENDLPTWTLGGDDAGDFDITPSSVENEGSNPVINMGLIFKTPPDYENPADTGGDNVYNVTVQLSDGKDAAGDADTSVDTTLAVTVTVTDVNEGPAVSGEAAVNYAENGAAAVASYTASDPESDTVTWTLGGGDAGDFNITPVSVENEGSNPVINMGLTFKTPPDYENPADEGGNNVYNVTVQVSDGKAADGSDDSSVDTSLAVTVTVTDVSEPPGKPTAPTVSSITATGLTITWTAPANTGPAITGYDVRYRPASSETWTDHGHSGTATTTAISGLEAGTSYRVQVRAVNDEGSGPWSGSLSFASLEAVDPGETPDETPVTNPVERRDENQEQAGNAAPVFSSGAAFSMAENRTAAGTVEAEDADSEDDITGYAITGGADAAKFAIGANTGALTFNTAPDYENPQDALSATPSNAAGNNEYVVVVTATGGADDRELTASQTIVVTVTNVNEPPAFSPIDKARYKVRYAENGTSAVATFSASDPESDVLTWSLKTLDAKDFSISSSGVLTFNASPDFEDPVDKNRNNVYKFNVQVSDGKAADGSTDGSVDAYLPVTVRVTDEDDGGDRAAQLPAQPSGFTPFAGNGSVTLEWDNPNDDRITLYQYKYGFAGAFGDGRWVEIPNSGADTVSFTVTGLENDVTYEFKVRARNEAGLGPSSFLVVATPSATE